MPHDTTKPAIPSKNCVNELFTFLPREHTGKLLFANKQLFELGLEAEKSQKAVEIITKYAGEVSKQFLPLSDINPVNLYERLTEEVLRAVVLGNEELVLALLKLHPEALLDNTQSVTDLSSKIISGLTPFQAALCAADELMIEKMKDVFKDKIPDGLAKMKKQFEEIYPNGNVKAVAKAQEGSANECPLLDAIFDAIDKARDDEVDAALDYTKNPNYILQAGEKLKDADAYSLAYALKKFRLDFDKLSQAEKVHNAYHLLKAFKLYGEYYAKIGGQWYSPKNMLALRQVIGYVQRHVPACLAQDFAHSIYDIANGHTHRNNVPRSFKFGGASFFSPSLGYDYAVVVDWARVYMHATAARPDLAGHVWPGFVRKLCQTKTSNLQNFIRPVQKLEPQPVQQPPVREQKPRKTDVRCCLIQ